jgi:hypothetical protein
MMPTARAIKPATIASALLIFFNSFGYFTKSPLPIFGQLFHSLRDITQHTPPFQPGSYVINYKGRDFVE